MTTRFSSKYVVLLLSIGFFFSCKKDDSPKPPPAKPSLVETVLGRWDASIPPPPRTSNSSVSPKSQDRPYITSVEFFSDSSYIVVMNHSYAYTGKCTVTDSTTLNIGGELGSLSGLSVSGDSLSISYDYYDMHFNVKAAKVPNVQVSDAKKALLKSWFVTKQEDGAYFYQMMQSEGDVYVTFSMGGTFLLTSSNGEDTYSEAMNWKWHPQEADAIRTYSMYNEEDNNIPYLKIVELTSTKLKVQEIAMEDGEKVVRHTFVLSSAK